MKENNTAAAVVTPEALPMIKHQGRPVVTTAILAKLYATEENNLVKNFQRNADRFEPGKHYYKVEGADLKDLKNYMTDSHVVKIASRARHLVLWTERGAARHAKMLDTDQAWDVFEKMEDCYFGKSEMAPVLIQGPAGLTPVQQRHIQQCVNHLAKHPGSSHQSVYSSIKDRFMVGTYKDIPATKYADLCRFLGSEPLEGEWVESQKADGVISFNSDEAQSTHLLISHAKRLVEMKEVLLSAGRAINSPVLIEVFSHLWEIQPHLSLLGRRKAGELKSIHDNRMSDVNHVRGLISH